MVAGADLGAPLPAGDGGDAHGSVQGPGTWQWEGLWLPPSLNPAGH